MTQKSTKKSVKKRAIKKTASKKPVEKKQANGDPLTTKTALVARDERIADKKPTPVAFSIDDIEALVASRGDAKEADKPKKAPVKKKAAPVKKKAPVKEGSAEKRVLGAASLSDILGFNPAEKKSATSLEEESVPRKWKKYYKLLIELRDHVRDEIDLHTSDTLQHNANDHAGDRTLEDDAGTDVFDRDFALSLVSSEQEALNEIEEALLRIKQGTYGVCEVTGKPIGKDRLVAVPFTRYSVEGQVEFEKNMRRKVDRSVGGLFVDGTESPKISSDEDDDDD